MKSSRFGIVSVFLLVCTIVFWSVPSESGWLDNLAESTKKLQAAGEEAIKLKKTGNDLWKGDKGAPTAAPAGNNTPTAAPAGNNTPATVQWTEAAAPADKGKHKKKKRKSRSELRDEARQNKAEAEWEAAVAEEKARQAKKELDQAEQEIYQEDLDNAINKTKQAIERERKASGHPELTAYWFLERKGVEEFAKKLNSYEVDGLSFGMPMSALKKTLTDGGYELYRRSIKNGAPVYSYRRRNGNAEQDSNILIYGTDFDDTPSRKIVIKSLHASGLQALTEEKIRLLDEFSWSCGGNHHNFFYCHKYTDTNMLSIELGSSSISYTFMNIPHSAAKQKRPR